MNRDDIISQVKAPWRETLLLDVFPELPSTNQYLVSQPPMSALAMTSAWVAVADLQTAGVGRRGKSWLSRPGNISFSLLRHFDVSIGALTGLSLVTGVTIADVLADLCGIDCQLKWPNDVYCQDAKLAGVLIEVPRSTASSCSVVCGMGINCMPFPRSHAPDQPVTSISELSRTEVTREEIIGTLIQRLLDNYARYISQGLDGFLAQWNARDYLAGKDVCVLSGQERLLGVADGIAGNGELQVYINGELQLFNAGEVSIRRR